MKRHLAGALVASLVVAACAANEEIDFLGATEPSENDAGTNAVILPPPSTGGDASTNDPPTASDGGKDSGKGDASTSDAGFDAGPPSPKPGDACTAQDQIANRVCGKCGRQETICQQNGSALAWSEYGPCSGEAGECLPGDTRPCGNCGTQTCNQYCGWAACGSEPPQSCSPGSIDFTTAGCPTGGFKSRSCSNTCQWQTYTTACETPKAVMIWASGPQTHSTFMRGNDGKIYGWGSDDEGQLGDSDTANKPGIVPTPFSNVTSMAVGGGTTYGFGCASFGDGSAKCWGDISTSYTLGDGTTGNSPKGVTPTGFDSDVKSIVAGYGHSCGLFTDGTAKCWGYNTYGQLGNGSTTTSKTPVLVSLTDITALYSGYYTLCARKADAAYCWGYNSDGQVGDNSTTSRSTPTQVIASGVASIAPGYYHTCAAMTDGTAKCWGNNTNGELGNAASSTTDLKVPTAVVGIDNLTPSLTNVAEICAGYNHSCARLNDGTVACWGNNSQGQLGTGDTSSYSAPKLVTGITTASKLVCGYQHSCVVDAGGLPKCWGNNSDGQIGNGGMPNDALTPQTATF